MKIVRSGEAASRKAGIDWFTGTVWLEPIIEAPEPARVRAAFVTFEPGARTNWHTHPLGQTLHVVSGTGRVQLEGEPVQVINAGDSVWIAWRTSLAWRGTNDTHDASCHSGSAGWQPCHMARSGDRRRILHIRN